MRRIPGHWYDPDPNLMDRQAFKPHKARDKDGLSLFREKYHTPQEIVDGAGGAEYHVTFHKAGDLRREGMELEPCPNAEFAGHSLVTNLNAGNRDVVTQINWSKALQGRLQSRPAVGPLSPAE